MSSFKVIAEGHGEYLKVDPDGFREYVRDHKQRAMVPKLMTEKEAIERFVADGDYLVYECNYLQRGPSALIREVIRQQSRTSGWARSLRGSRGACLSARAAYRIWTSGSSSSDRSSKRRSALAR